MSKNNAELKKYPENIVPSQKEINKFLINYLEMVRIKNKTAATQCLPNMCYDVVLHCFRKKYVLNTTYFI